MVSWPTNFASGFAPKAWGSPASRGHALTIDKIDVCASFNPSCARICLAFFLSAVVRNNRLCPYPHRLVALIEDTKERATSKHRLVVDVLEGRGGIAKGPWDILYIGTMTPTINRHCQILYCYGVLKAVMLSYVRIITGYRVTYHQNSSLSTSRAMLDAFHPLLLVPGGCR